MFYEMGNNGLKAQKQPRRQLASQQHASPPDDRRYHAQNIKV
jgi:hypothetical protein